MNDYQVWIFTNKEIQEYIQAFNEMADEVESEYLEYECVEWRLWLKADYDDDYYFQYNYCHGLTEDRFCRCYYYCC